LAVIFTEVIENFLAVETISGLFFAVIFVEAVKNFLAIKTISGLFLVVSS
jgi:hypothetical protein